MTSPFLLAKSASGFFVAFLSAFVSVLIALVLFPAAALAQEPVSSARVSTVRLNEEIRTFLTQQISAHVADIKTLNPPPDRVVGALTTGDFSWGTFMGALAAYSAFGGTRTVAGRDVVEMLGQMALIELSHGGETWAQLYAAQALRSFGTDLNHNVLWQGLTPEEKTAYLKLLDPGRFYDARTHTLIGLPQNYFGVAARIAAISYQLGVNTNRTALNDLLDQAARQFTEGALFADDAVPTGRYDRYSNEYARNIYEAAVLAGRGDIMKAVARSLKAQMQLWWELMAPDGYGYSWGRSLGDISYTDTMQIVAFVAKYPEFRPANISELAAAYYQAWRSLRSDFNDSTHLFSVFAFGRGDYGYITKAREWQQTTSFFGKIISADATFMKVLEKEGVTSFPAELTLPDVDRYVSFRAGPGRQFGVWVVRRGTFHFALPFVTGPKAATSDYEPAPDGLPGFEVPVEKVYPCLTPFLEVGNGSTIAATDGADDIRIAGDGESVTAVWRRWIVVGSKAGTTVDPGLITKVTWSIKGDSLRRVETITAAKPVTVRRFWVAVPSTANHVETSFANGVRQDLLSAKGSTLKVQVVHSDWPLRISVFATGDDALGRGAQRPIPLHLVLESGAISFAPGSSKAWSIELSVISTKSLAAANAERGFSSESVSKP
jgi:hypothetical protein